MSAVYVLARELRIFSFFLFQLQTVQLMFKQSCIVLVKLQQIIEKANNQGKEELEKMAELEKQKKEKEEKERKLQQPVKVSIGGDVKGTVTQPQTQQQQQQQTQQQPLQQNSNNVSIGGMYCSFCCCLFI